MYTDGILIVNHTIPSLHCSPPHMHTTQGCADVSDKADTMVPQEDIKIACGNYGTGANNPEQLLYESFVSLFVVIVSLLFLVGVLFILFIDEGPIIQSYSCLFLVLFVLLVTVLLSFICCFYQSGERVVLLSQTVFLNGC